VNADVEELEKEIADTLSRLQKKRHSAQRNSRNLFLAQAFLVFTATVCLGLAWPAMELALRNAALVFNTAATLTATIAGYFNFRDRWIQHSKTVGELRALQGDLRLFHHNIEGGSPIPPELDDYRHRMRAILGESMEKWMAISAAPPPGDASSKNSTPE
jgi:hypothetical protein